MKKAWLAILAAVPLLVVRSATTRWTLPLGSPGERWTVPPAASQIEPPKAAERTAVLVAPDGALLVMAEARAWDAFLPNLLLATDVAGVLRQTYPGKEVDRCNGFAAQGETWACMGVDPVTVAALPGRAHVYYTGRGGSIFMVILQAPNAAFEQAEKDLIALVRATPFRKA